MDIAVTSQTTGVRARCDFPEERHLPEDCPSLFQGLPVESKSVFHLPDNLPKLVDEAPQISFCLFAEIVRDPEEDTLVFAIGKEAVHLKHPSLNQHQADSKGVLLQRIKDLIMKIRAFDIHWRCSAVDSPCRLPPCSRMAVSW